MISLSEVLNKNDSQVNKRETGWILEKEAVAAGKRRGY
jgi:hypothetical protein